MLSFVFYICSSVYIFLWSRYKRCCPLGFVRHILVILVFYICSSVYIFLWRGYKRCCPLGSFRHIYTDILVILCIVFLTITVFDQMSFYNIVRSVQAGFHQGHETFGATKGIQCSCISLFSVCFSVFKSVSAWNKNDLEYVLEKGDLVYKAQNSITFLSVPELPTTLVIEDFPLTLNFGADRFGFLHRGSNCISELILNLSLPQLSHGILLFCKSYCFSIIIKNDQIFVVDSHSRDADGKPCASGAAIILQFCNIYDVALFIKDLYLNQNEPQCQYEIQYIFVETRIMEYQRQLVLRKHKSDSQKLLQRDKWKIKKQRKRKLDCKSKETCTP